MSSRDSCDGDKRSPVRRQITISGFRERTPRREADASRKRQSGSRKIKADATRGGVAVAAA
jgi:hypothetical protein